MNTLLHVREGLFGWVLHTTWQGAILAVLIVLTQRVLGQRISPAWRYGFWLVLIARLVLPVAPESAWSLFNLTKVPEPAAWAAQPVRPEPIAPVVALHDVSAPSQPSSAQQPRSDVADKPGKLRSIQTPSTPGRPVEVPTVSVRLDWYHAVMWVWLVGACLLTARLCWANLRFWMRIAAEPPVTNEPLRRQFEECRAALGIRRTVGLIETGQVQSPSVHGLLRTRVLLPTGVFDRFSPEELRCIFLHELAHIRRHELEVNWLASLLQAVHWFNPVLWLAFARMRIDREVACDALALAHLGKTAAAPYGETILKVVENLGSPSSAPGLLALSEDKRQLQERIRMIAGFGKRPTFSVVAAALVAGVAVVGLTDANQVPTSDSPAPLGGAARAATGGRPGTTSEGAGRPSQDRIRPETGDRQNNLQGLPTRFPDRTDSQRVSDGVLAEGIRARVVDPHGNPVSEAIVKCQGFKWQMRTDSEGRFVCAEASEARAFTVKKSGFTTLVTGLLTPGADERVLHLQQAPVIGGKVIDRETREPISSFNVYLAALLQGPVSPTLMDDEPVRGRSGTFTYSFNRHPPADAALYIEAEGFLPVVSHPFTASDDGHQLVFELTRTEPFTGKVLTPDGAPADHAEVRFWFGQRRINTIPPRYSATTDRAGGFSLARGLDGEFVVSHGSGYAEVPLKEFTATHTIQLLKWGKVKGSWPKPWPKSRILWLQRIEWSDEMFTLRPPWEIAPARIKPDGGFEFEDSVPPGEYRLGEMTAAEMALPGGATSKIGLMSRRVPLLVEAARTSVVELAAGRTVLGRLAYGDGRVTPRSQLPIVRLSLKQWSPAFYRPPDNYPVNSPALSDRSRFDGLRDYRDRVVEYWLSDEGKDRRRKEYVVEIMAEADGSFRIDHVPPGTYQLDVNPEQYGRVPGARARHEVVVLEGADETPIDLGLLK